MQAPQADGRVPLNRLTKNSDEAPGGVGLAHTKKRREQLRRESEMRTGRYGQIAIQRLVE
jgi:hypothetical protein